MRPQHSSKDLIWLSWRMDEDCVTSSTWTATRRKHCDNQKSIIFHTKDVYKWLWPFELTAFPEKQNYQTQRDHLWRCHLYICVLAQWKRLCTHPTLQKSGCVWLAETTVIASGDNLCRQHCLIAFHGIYILNGITHWWINLVFLFHAHWFSK